MEKFYTRTTWENSPSTKTPINETNLNNIEGGVSELDERVANLSNQKSSVDWVQLRKSGTKIAEVTIDGVKKDVYAPNGSGGGGGGTTDYEDLDNKPSINGVSLVGNKTNSDLGIIIPTTLAELEEDTTHRTVTDAQITKWNQGGSGGGGTAETTTYDNSTSGLDAENVQDAIDELNEDLTHKTMSGTSAEFDAIKDDASIPNGSSFDITDDYEDAPQFVFVEDRVDSNIWINRYVIPKLNLCIVKLCSMGYVPNGASISMSGGYLPQERSVVNAISVSSDNQRQPSAIIFETNGNISFNQSMYDTNGLFDTQLIYKY